MMNKLKNIWIGFVLGLVSCSSNPEVKPYKTGQLVEFQTKNMEEPMIAKIAETRIRHRGIGYFVSIGCMLYLIRHNDIIRVIPE